MAEKKKKYELTKKGWIVLISLFVVILAATLFFTLNNKPNFEFKPIEVEISSEEKLRQAYNNKEISTDEYVMHLAYIVYEPNKLSEKYKSDIYYHTPSIGNILNMYKDELSDETIQYIENKLSLRELKVGPTEKTSYFNSSSVLPVSNTLANDEKVATRLESYVASPNKKVIVWYTTRDTADKTSHEKAKSLADEIEKIIDYLSNEFGIVYKWEPAYLNGYDENSYKSLLNDVAPNDANELIKAMPIYVSTAANDEAHGYYAPMKPGKYGNHKYDGTDELAGVPVGPYINLNTEIVNNDDTNSYLSTLAHEMFHHYQVYICGEGKYEPCERNEADGADPLFVLETTAVWVEAKYTPNAIQMVDRAATYYNNLNKKIDTIDPYSGHLLLMNYEMTVGNSKEKITNSLIKSKNSGNTLKYLYDQSDGKMPDVMRSLSKNNIINDYEHENFKGAKTSNYAFVTSAVDIDTKTSYATEAMAINYYHTYNKDEKYKISLSDTSSSYVTIFSVDSIDSNNVVTLNKTYENIDDFKTPKVVYSQKYEKDIVVDFSKIDGNFFILAISNGNLSSSINYSINKTDEEANIEINKGENPSNPKLEKPNKVFDIYLDNELIAVDNFELNGRAYVDINQFCDNSKMCSVKYTDDSHEKVSISSNVKFGASTYTYTLLNEKNKEVFDSNLAVGKVNFDLSQLSVDASSCPSGKDSNGFDIPSCDESAYYVPIRFVTQALGYDVEWKAETNTRIDISSGLQEKLIKDLDIKTVLSKDKIAIGDEVTNIIDLGNEVSLEKNQVYYAYSIDKDNKRVFNSGFSLLSGDENVFKITNDLNTNKNKDTTYSMLEIKNEGVSVNIAIVTTITIPSEDSNYKCGIYPIVKEVKVLVK